MLRAFARFRSGVFLASSTSAVALALAAAWTAPAHAQTFTDIAGGSNIGATVPLPVIGGDTWNLQGDGSYLVNNIALPPTGAGLTVNGNGNTLNLNNGTSYGTFTGSTVTLGLNSVTISNGRQASGGVINGSASVMINADGAVTFSGNAATTSGGGGGAIMSGGPLTINLAGASDTITFDRNSSAGTGGAIRTIGETSIATTAGNTVITNNTSTSLGGAIYSGLGLTIGNAGGTVTVTGNSGVDGGAIVSGGTTILTGSTITLSNNTATRQGGAISSAQTVTLNGNTIVNNNSAQSNGGGIYSYAGSIIVNGDLTANGNRTGSNGGVLIANANNSTQNARTVVTGGVSMVGNSAAVSGGAIALMGSTGSVSLAETNGNVSFTNNTAVNKGGVIWAQGGSISIGNTDGAVSFSGNRTTSTVLGGTGQPAANGGVIANDGSGQTAATIAVAIRGKSIDISNNTATGSGGAISTLAGSVVINGAFTASGNRATGESGSSGGTSTVSAIRGMGGVIAAMTGSIVIDSSTSSDGRVNKGIVLDGNSAQSGGGALYTGNGGTISLAATAGDVYITRNTALSGGGISATGNVTIGNTGGVVFIGVDSAGNAAGNTATGDGGGILTSGGVMLTGTTVNISNNVAAAGGGVRISSYTTADPRLIINGDLVAENNYATRSTYGGGGAVASTYRDIIVNGSATVTGNITAYMGGAFNVGFDAVRLSTTVGNGNVVITNNSATAGGGAIMAGGAVVIGNSGGTVTITGNRAGVAYSGPGTAVAENANAIGGAIYGGLTTLTGTAITVSDNRTTGNGGAISAIGMVANGDLTMTGNSSANGNGGAVFSGASGTGTVTINNGLTLRENTAGLAGGGIYVNTGNLTVGGGVGMGIVADANIARSGAGGAFYVASGTMTLASASGSGNVSLTNNIASGNGGAASVSSTSTIGNSGGTVTITGNRAGYDADGNQLNVTANGGALYGGNAVTISGSTVTVSDNIASNAGGGIFNQNLAITVSGNINAYANVAANGNGGAFASNSVTGGIVLAQSGGSVALSDNIAAKNGGAVFSNAAVRIGASSSVVAISGNRAGYDADGDILNSTGNGGAIYSATGVNIYGTGIRFSDNLATQNGGGVYGGQSVSFNGNLLASGNMAQNGGVTYTQTGNITATGGVDAYGNAATNGNGGAFTANAGAVYLAQNGGAVSLDANTASAAGGAVYAGTSATIGNIYAPVVITGNSAGTSGGAVYGGGTVTLTGSSILLSDNFATQDGGGVYAGQGATVNGAFQAQTNEARNGGAVYARTGAIMTTGDVSADGNTASDGFGGAFAASSGPVNLAHGSGAVSLTNNRAATNGGAVYAGTNAAIGNSAGTVSITGNNAGINGGAVYSGGAVALTGWNILLADNFATQDGGAIFAGSEASLTGQTLSLTGNKAENGGAVQAASASVTGRLTATGNEARTGDGGVISAFSGSIATNGGLSVTGNQAASRGGAFFAATGMSLANASGSLSDNTAGASGGAAFADGSFTLSTAAAMDIAGNRANAGDGGAIAANGPITIASGGGELSFSNNAAFTKGGAVWAGGDVTLEASGGDISFSGNTHGDPLANAIWFANSAGGATATFGAGAGNSITFFDPIANDTANGLINVVKTGGGAVIFDGAHYAGETERWSRMFADTRVQEGVFEVSNNAVYGAFASDAAAAPLPATSFTTESGATLAGGVIGTVRADSMALNGDINIAGRHPETRGVMNLTTNSLTFGGGAVYFNTFLDDGASQNTDLLVLNLNGSATSGQAQVVVNGIGGTGARTTGDGIRIVQTNDGTSNGAFILASRVAAGIYEYGLYQGGFAPTGGDPDDQHWYLRNTLEPPPGPDPEPVPNIRVEVPVDMAVTPLAIEYGYSLLNSLHERAGEVRMQRTAPVTEERVVWCKDPRMNFRCTVRTPVATANGPATADTAQASTGWAKLFGDRGIRDRGDFFSYGADYDYTFSGMQAGFDVHAGEGRDGSLDKAGIYVAYGQISSTVQGVFGGQAGGVDMDVYSVAAYWTHMAAQGWYTDAVLQGTWYAANAHSVLGQQIKPDGFGMAVSLEGGYTLKLGNGFALEPQAQVIYQNVSFNDARDTYGSITFDNGESLRGRLGLRLARSWNREGDASPRLITAWLRANVWHEFLGKTRIAVGSTSGLNMVPFTTSLGGTWGEVGAGVTAQLNEKANLFATGAYSRSLDGKGRQGWDGRLGMNVKW